MNKELDPKAASKWKKSNISYNNYLTYIKDKKRDLTFIDLLYISNFKGGNSTINEDEIIINTKLKAYTKLFIEIDNIFGEKNLSELTDSEVETLIDFANKTIALTHKENISHIDGFSVSYLSALLHCHFPNLYPILDRRVLHGLDFIKANDVSSTKQIINLERFYPKLILAFKKEANFKTLREIDKAYFQYKIPETKDLPK